MRKYTKVRENIFREPTLPNDLTSQIRSRILNLPASVRTDYLKKECFSKFVSKDTDPPLVRRNRAIFKLLCAEQDNEATEDRLLTAHPDFQILPGVAYQQFIDWCQALVIGIIGEVPPTGPGHDVLSRLPLETQQLLTQDVTLGSFSGGASTSRPRTRSQPALKYYGIAHVTERSWDNGIALLQSCSSWLNAQNSSSLRLETVPGNVLFTVPKKTDIDRCAAKEPDLNMFIQKGIGTYFRKCLLRAKINLNDQSINRSLARVGSIDGSLATLDLSSASDSITRELVFQILPVHWFTLLDSARSQVTSINGEEHRNTMFSNMGNGFTFELESLLFYVLMRAVAYFTGTRGIVSVYGDDLIIPTQMADKAIYVLGFCGFQVNPDKSFTQGPLRESCGGHYYNGYDITPFYVKAPIESLVDLIDVANKLRKWGSPSDLTGRYPIIDPDIEDLWLWLKSLVPSILWGGRDTSFKYQLVSHDTPTGRLVEETERKGAGDGGYSMWLNATRYRTDLTESLETSTFTRNKNRLRFRKVRDTAVTRPEAWFMSELT